MRPAAKRAAGGAASGAAAKRPAKPAAGRQGHAVARPLAAAAALPLRALRGANNSSLLDRLLRGRAWVVCVAVLLAGIVFFNVSLLERGSGIASTSERAAALKRENAGLRQRVARLGSSERVQELAQARGMFLPAPGDVRYLRLDPAGDGQRAVRRMRAPGEEGATSPAATPTAGPPASAPAPTAPAPGATGAPVTSVPAQPEPSAPAPQAAAPTQSAPPAAPQG